VVFTASAVMRGTKAVPLKQITDDAIKLAEQNGYRDVKRVLVYEKSALPRFERERTHPDSQSVSEV
jgi:acyl-coenzyme A synthetase/AMP-(fatty) acid ligase